MNWKRVSYNTCRALSPLVVLRPTKLFFVSNTSLDKIPPLWDEKRLSGRCKSQPVDILLSQEEYFCFLSNDFEPTCFLLPTMLVKVCLHYKVLCWHLHLCFYNQVCDTERVVDCDGFLWMVKAPVRKFLAGCKKLKFILIASLWLTKAHKNIRSRTVYFSQSGFWCL